MNEFDETLDGSDSQPRSWPQDDSARNPLELLADEYSAARRSGANPSIEEFINRVPEQREEARALLQSLALFERVSEQEATRYAASRKQKRVALPHHEQLGDYRIIREIGRGGMGVIYEAEQISLKRRVALKVLSAGSESAKQLERFQREAEAIARLHHTNIVPVYGSGAHAGVHYFAMQLIDGLPLSQPPQLSFIEIARLGSQAASALAYAHSHGVLHRDIKPSNLLLDKSGDLWVTDFGLAKLSDVGDLTHTGDIMGTLKYMAPEQLEGRADARTDVYALGLTLYELVTRQPAFDISKSLANRIRNHDFAAPRSIDDSIPRDLETIILKATACEPKHRYQTAQELGDDLRRFMEDRPIEARRASSAERLGRWMRRNPALATSLCATALLLIATTIVTSVGYLATHHALQDTKRARDDANSARLQADEARKLAETSQSRAENNLSVALKAFDAIFDNVARRGVPQSLTLDVNVLPENTDPAKNTTAGTQEEPPPFEPTLTAADAELLNNLLSFYRQFTQQNSEDDALLIRTARAYQRIGQIQDRLGQGEAAIDSYGQSLTMLKGLRDRHPENTEAILASAEILNDLGLAFTATGKPLPTIIMAHKFAFEFLNMQGPEINKLPSVRFEKARAYGLAGSVLARGGASALEDFMPGAPPGERPFDGPERRDGPRPGEGFRPGDGPRPRRDGNGNALPGDPNRRDSDDMNDLESRLRRFFPSLAAITMPRGPNDRGPNDRGPNDRGPNDRGPNDRSPNDRGLNGEAVGGRRPGGFGRDGRMGGPIVGPLVEALAGGLGGPFGGRDMIESDLQSSRQLLFELTEDFPNEFDYQLAYARSLRHLMMHYMSKQRVQDASDAFQKARSTLTTLRQNYPNEPKVMVEMADTLSSAALRLSSLTEAESEEVLRQAIAICLQLCEAFPSVPEYQALLATSQDRLGTVESRKRHWAAADREFVRSIDRMLDLLNRFPENRFYQVSTIVASRHLADLRLSPESELNDPMSLATARGYLEKSLESFRRQTFFDRFVNRIVNEASDSLLAVYRELGDEEAAHALREKRKNWRGM